MENENTFGYRLRFARKAQGLTQKQLASLIDAAHNSISNWENNQNMPDPDTIVRICEVLGITAGYLLDTEDNRSLPTNVNSDKLSDGALSVALAYDQMDIWGKQAVDAVVAVESARCSTAPQAPSAGDLVPAADPRERKKSV